MTDNVIDNPLTMLDTRIKAINDWVNTSPDLVTLKTRIDEVIKYRLAHTKTGILCTHASLVSVEELGTWLPKFSDPPKLDHESLQPQPGQNPSYFLVKNPEDNRLFYVFSWDVTNWLIKRSGDSYTNLILCEIGKFSASTQPQPQPQQDTVK